MKSKMIGRKSFLFMAWFLMPAFFIGSYAQDTSSHPPAWFQEHMDFMMQNEGRWITDNATYQSETEPFDAYGMEWKWGIGKKSLIGRLYGLKDGKEAGTFWEFREVWHPGEQKVMLYQFGGAGTFGLGSVASIGENQTQTEQHFFNPDHTGFQVGHRSTHTEAGTLHTQSYDIMEDGTWKKRRLYIWKRVNA